MGWRERLLPPRPGHDSSEPAATPEYDAGRETPEDPSSDSGDSLAHRLDPDEAVRAEMAEMAARAAERALAEELDNHRVAMMTPGHRLEYRQMRWEAINAAKLTGMSPQRIEQEYGAFRFAQWEQQNAQRIAAMSPGERQELFLSEEMLIRYRAGLPPRDDEERDAYREWRQLDADVVNAYREEADIPEQLWDEYAQGNSPLSREEFFAQYFGELSEERAASEHPEPSITDRPSFPEAEAAHSVDPPAGDDGAAATVVRSSPLLMHHPMQCGGRPARADAGSGLEDEPVPARAPCSEDGGKPRPSSPAPPPTPRLSDQTRPGGVEGPNGSVPRP